MGPPKKPVFKPPVLLTSELNVVADRAFGVITIDGGNVEDIPGVGTHISVPPPLTELWVAVKAEPTVCYNTAKSGTTASSAPPRTPYSWVLQDPAQCGTWVPKSPFGFTADAITNPAYEDNNALVTDGSIQLIRPRLIRPDPANNRVITEWSFRAGGGSGSNTRVVGPRCITAVSRQVCCDGKAGFSAQTWYRYVYNGVEFWFTDKTQAADCVESLNQEVCFEGECPPEDS